LTVGYDNGTALRLLVFFGEATLCSDGYDNCNFSIARTEW
jgi:hypothetical protein